MKSATTATTASTASTEVQVSVKPVDLPAHRQKKPRWNVASRLIIALVLYFGAMYTYLGILLLAGGVEKTRTEYSFLSTMNIGIGLFLTAVVFLIYR